MRWEEQKGRRKERMKSRTISITKAFPSLQRGYSLLEVIAVTNNEVRVSEENTSPESTERFQMTQRRVILSERGDTQQHSMELAFNKCEGYISFHQAERRKD